jgi:UDP-3-O-[3-hydroxymyristoyl] glucosamine N-acyltransferase
MKITAAELAHLLHGTVDGDPNMVVFAPAKIEEATEGTIAFLANPKYESYIYTTLASIILVENTFLPNKKLSATLVRVENVRDAVAFLLEKMDAQNNQSTAIISEKADIHPSVKLGKNVQIGAFAVLESGAEIGDDVQISPQVFVGKNVKIGTKTRLETGVKILFGCEIGENCHIFANAVIGSDGFGYAPQADFSWKKVPQVGIVILENNVEIGANSTIDRATMGSTLVKKGTKIDNLVHLAHNVEIGENTVIAAQVGIAGSAKIGSRVQMGGQVGIVGHVSIADGTKIQAQSGVAGAVKEPNTAIFGSPAIGYTDFQRSFIVFKKLPEMSRKVAELERELAKLKVH